MAIKKDYNDPLSIWNEMAAVDNKDYEFYDRLTDDQKKIFSPYLILKWGSAVEGNGDISKYYAVSANEFANIDFFNLSKHKKLQWLVCCAISPKIGKQRHYWLGGSKRKGSSALKNLILEQLPTIKESDVDLILHTQPKEEIFQWLRNSGIDEKILKPLQK